MRYSIRLGPTPRPSGPGTLAKNLDLPFLANLGGMTLACTKSETLKLVEDFTGLLATATLDPRNSVVSDLWIAMESGDADEMSFAFASWIPTVAGTRTTPPATAVNSTCTGRHQRGELQHLRAHRRGHDARPRAFSQRPDPPAD